MNPGPLGLTALAVWVVTVAAPATAQSVYDFEWRSFASQSAWQGEPEPVTVRGQLTGRGVVVLEPIGDDLVRFYFSGPEGAGSGVVGPGGPENLVFPTAIPVGEPPAPQHLIGGSFTIHGDPRQPSGFEITYTEGFICRTTPEHCAGVTVWERSFYGRGTRSAPRSGLGTRLRTAAWRDESAPAPEAAPSVEAALADEVNRIRGQRGLGRLAVDAALTTVARHHSCDMARRRFLGHDTPEETGPGERLRRAERPYRRVGENVARVTGDRAPAATAVRGWMDSAGHRANILDAEFIATGVGACRDGDTYYFTQVFLAPP